MTWKRVVVHWIDSTHIRQAWWGYREFEKYVKNESNKDEMISTGFLFMQNRRFIYLANSIDFQGGELIHFGGIFAIPQGCITKIKTI